MSLCHQLTILRALLCLEKKSIPRVLPLLGARLLPPLWACEMGIGLASPLGLLLWPPVAYPTSSIAHYFGLARRLSWQQWCLQQAGIVRTKHVLGSLAVSQTSRPFQRGTVESCDSQAISLFLRQFTVLLAPGALASIEGGGRLVESAADWFSPVYR
jgi:hypothetical protein